MNTRFAGSAYRHFLLWGICASLATTVCTIVDALLVGNLVGSSGLAVSNIATPVFLFYAMLGVTVGVGANIHIGNMLGKADKQEANRFFHVQLGLGFAISLLMLSPLLFKDVYFSMLGVTGELKPLAQQYLTVVMWSAPVFVMYHILSVSVRTDSDPKCAAVASVVVIVTNLSLDIFFMKVLQWGIVGASASLCIAELLGSLVLCTHFFKKRRLLTFGITLPKLREIKQILSNGFSIGAANIFGAIVMLVFNTMLLRFSGAMGPLYVASYGVIYTVSTIPAGFFDGASNALSTTTAFFAGEADVEGIFTVLKKALRTVLTAGGMFAIVCAVFAGQLLAFFGIEDVQTIKTGTVALRIFTLSMIFTGINMVVTAFWQTIGRSRIAAIFSALRNCVGMLLFGFLLIPGENIIGVSICYVATEAVCSLLCLGVLFLHPSRKYICQRYQQGERCFERDYAIKTESAQQISQDIEALCDEWNIGMKQALFINFVCEELLLNIIKFGLNDEKKAGYVSIKLMETNGEYVLRIRDNVNCYNPFESEGDEIDNGVLNLIKTKAKYYDYQRKMIFNYLYMVI